MPHIQEIIKEISMMQQCDNEHVVKYYGSYFKKSDLWVRIMSPSGPRFRMTHDFPHSEQLYA